MQKIYQRALNNKIDYLTEDQHSIADAPMQKVNYKKNAYIFYFLYYRRVLIILKD